MFYKVLATDFVDRFLLEFTLSFRVICLHNCSDAMVFCVPLSLSCWLFYRVFTLRIFAQKGNFIWILGN